MADKGASARKEINAATERGFIIPSIKLVTLLMMIRPMSDLIKYVRMQYDMAVRKGRKQWIKEIRRDIEFVLKPSQIDEHLPSLDGSKKKMPQKIAAPANLTTTASTSGMCHLGNNTATKRECIEHPEPLKRLREDSANSTYTLEMLKNSSWWMKLAVKIQWKRTTHHPLNRKCGDHENRNVH